MKKKHLALFDLDGTITSKDTMIEFIRYVRGSWKLYLSYFVLSPVLLGYKLKLIANDKAKQMLLHYHFSGEKEAQLRGWGAIFCQEKFLRMQRKAAIGKLRYHQEQGHEVVVISASLDIWIKPWLAAEGLRFLSTEAEWENGRFTGRFSGANCYGAEKVRRLQEILNPDDYEVIYAYGDSSGDKEMLGLADQPFYRKF